LRKGLQWHRDDHADQSICKIEQQVQDGGIASRSYCFQEKCHWTEEEYRIVTWWDNSRQNPTRAASERARL